MQLHKWPQPTQPMTQLQHWQPTHIINSIFFMPTTTSSLCYAGQTARLCQQCRAMEDVKKMWKRVVKKQLPAGRKRRRKVSGVGKRKSVKGKVWRRVLRPLRGGQEAELEAAEVKSRRDQEGGRRTSRDSPNTLRLADEVTLPSSLVATQV